MSLTTSALPAQARFSPGMADNRFGRRPVRNTLIAALSVVVLLLGALFVSLPAQTGVAFAVTESHIAGKHSVVYGKVVDRHGDAVNRARVKLIRWVDGERQLVRSDRTGRRGLYRFELRHPKLDTYNLRVAKVVDGRRYVGVRQIKMRPGTAYKVSARLVRSGNIFFMPVTTY